MEQETRGQGDGDGGVLGVGRVFSSALAPSVLACNLKP